MPTNGNPIASKVGATISGVTNTFTVTNPSNTASSAARETIVVGGASAADPTLNWNVSGVTNWEAGIDNSDSDKWKLSQGTALGTNDTIVAFTTGEVLKPRQSAFRAYLGSNDSNVTGDGTIYRMGTNVALTIEYDQNSDMNTNGIFTAPVTAVYLFNGIGTLFGATVAYSGLGFGFVVNAGVYAGVVSRGGNQDGAGGGTAFSSSLTIRLTAGDTVYFYVYAIGSTKTCSILAGTTLSWFAGTLLC